jgi:hypothetical protein
LPFESPYFVVKPGGAYSAWRVGRNRISFTSTSSGWLMAKVTAGTSDDDEFSFDIIFHVQLLFVV